MYTDIIQTQTQTQLYVHFYYINIFFCTCTCALVAAFMTDIRKYQTSVICTRLQLDAQRAVLH